MARGGGGHRAIRCSGRRGPGGEVISAFRGRFQRGGQTCRAFFVHPEIVTGKRPSNRPPGRKVFLIRPGRAWRSGRTPKRIAFPRPVQGPRPHRTVPASATKASARRGRGGRWPGLWAPGGRGVSAALWQGRWPLPMERCSRFSGFRSGSLWGCHVSAAGTEHPALRRFIPYG